MIINPQVPLHRLILSLSEALDHVHPRVVDHQQRVAYIATNIARQLGIRGTDLLNLFNAAALHDIGLIGVENRIRALGWHRVETVAWHAEVGYELLKDHPILGPTALPIRYHHIVWADGAGAESDTGPVPLESHILALADHIEMSINRTRPILHQMAAILQEVTEGAGPKYHPDCVRAFTEVAGPEAFWLDLVYERIYSILMKQVDWPMLTLDEGAVGPIAEIFARIVDGSSPWTAVHTAGVTASAVALAERFNFSPRELHLMRAAGYLHDLGKLSVPVQILDKAGALTQDERDIIRGHTYHTFRILDTIGGMPQVAEWAAFHHERLDGKGYPFRHDARSLTLGSRIMSVADVFTALAEDRPYRAHMGPAESRGILDRLVSDGSLDGDVVAIVERDYEAIDARRREEQAAYGEQQKHLGWLMRKVESPMPVTADI